MNRYISLLILFLICGFCNAQNGFYGKRLSVAGAVLLNRPGGFTLNEKVYPTVDLGLRYAMGGRGQFAINFSTGKIDFLRRMYFEDQAKPYLYYLFFSKNFPIQNVSSIFIEQRLFRKHSYAPVGSYLGFGIGFHNYRINEGIIETEFDGIRHDIPLEQSVQTNFFLNDYYLTMGKVIPLGKKLLLDIHLRFNGFYLTAEYLGEGDIYYASNYDDEIVLDQDEISGDYSIQSSQYETIEINLKSHAQRYQRNIPRLIFSIQYLLF